MPPPCKKMIPLYPVRYAVKGKAGAPSYASQSTLEKTFPALQKASYTLQTIPDDFYILIVEEYYGVTHFRLFHNSSERMGFVEVDWTKYSKESGAKPVYKDVARSYIPINHQVSTLHIGLSEYPITPKMVSKLTGAYKSKVMLQEIPIGSWTKTSPSPHTFHVDKLEGLLEEFTSDGDILYHEKLSPFKSDVPRQVASDMKREYTPKILEDPQKDKRIVIALHDPVGITEDLNAFLGIQQQELQKYVDKEGHRYTSGKMVSNYINNVVPNQAEIAKRKATAAEKIRAKYKNSRYRKEQTERALKESAKDITAEMRDPLERAYKSLKDKKATVNKIYKHRKAYEEKIKTFEPNILASASDALIWAKMIRTNEPLDKHLAIHDPKCPRSWKHYEKQVSNCINATINSAQGEKFIFELIKAKPEDSPIWKALAKGDKELWKKITSESDDTLNNVGNFVSKLSEFDVQGETVLLAGLLKPFFSKNPTTVPIYLKRLSGILEYRAGYSLRLEQVPSTIVYNYAVDYIHDGKKLTGINAKIHKQILPNYKVKLTPNIKTVPLYTLEKIGETTIHSPQNNPFKKVAEGKTMGALGNMITIAGAIVSAVTLESSIRNINDGEDNTGAENATFWAASASFASASISLAGMGKTISQTRKGYDQAIIKATQKAFLKWVGVAGVISSSLTALSDGFKADQLLQLGNSESAHLRIASSALNGATAIATGVATYSMVTGATLVLGPVGWFVLALVLAGAAIYAATQSKKAEFTPAEFWLKNSPWGLSPRLNKIEETEVFYKAFFKPNVTVDWDDTWGADILTLSFYLPQYQAEKSTFEWKNAVKATLDDRKLNPVLFEQGQAYISKPYDEVDWDKDFRIYEQLEVGKGFAVVVISIHVNDSAKVNFAYNYYPHGVESGLILMHDKKGESWEFKDDIYFWNETIKKDKLEILSTDDRLEYINN